jgi:hypothetical protein
MAARTAVVAGTATAVAGGVQHHQQQKYQNQYEQEQYEQQQAAQEAQAQQQAAMQQQAAAQQQAAPADDLMTRLQQLATLHTQGVLTDEEFSAAKAKLLT